MWECEYAKEPVDYKLLGLRFLRKIWIVAVSAVVGCILVAGLYYAVKMIQNGGRIYQADSLFYLNLGQDDTGKNYDYYNYYTWNEIIDGDFFADGIYENMGGRLTKDEIREAVSASVEYDPRYLIVSCRTHSAELSLELARAVEPLLPGFVDTRKEFESVELTRAADEVKDSTDIRLLNACGLGVFLGVFFSVLGILIVLTLDTSVYLPVTLERRYHLVTLGAPFMSEFSSNLEYMLGKAKKIAVVYTDVPVQVKEMDGLSVVICENPVEKPEELMKIRECDAVVLCVKAAGKNGKRIERCLEQLARQDIAVTATVLAEADEKLINAYYGSKK